MLFLQTYYITDFKTEASDPHDFCQQFEIQRRSSSGFTAKFVAPDGFPLSFLRRKGWTVTFSTPTPNQTQAVGLDMALRARLSDPSCFPLSEKKSPAVVVGKWYCPFIFIKEGTLEHQIDSSRYYEMTLEQRWEQIFWCEKENYKGNNVVFVDVVIESEAVEVCGKANMYEYDENNNGVMWFKSLDKMEIVGLSLGVVEKMKWEQVRFGWNSGERRVRVDEFGGGNWVGWKKFRCYVLVERFVLKRMNRSLVLTYSFKHPQHTINKWK